MKLLDKPPIWETIAHEVIAMARRQKKIFVDDVECVLTRDAAMMLGVSMTHLRSLGRNGVIQPELVKERTVFYPVAAVKEYRDRTMKNRKEHKRGGAEPQGFSAS